MTIREIRYVVIAALFILAILAVSYLSGAELPDVQAMAARGM
jgi:hypothetical protein